MVCMYSYSQNKTGPWLTKSEYFMDGFKLWTFYNKHTVVYYYITVNT